MNQYATDRDRAIERLTSLVNERIRRQTALRRIVTNFSVSGIRRETYNGREYLVAPITLIVPGVLDGSDGPIYYPAEENHRSKDKWNGMPLMVYHPTDSYGNLVSANAPGQREKACIGFLHNASVDEGGRLQADGWFDVSRTQAIDSRIYSALINRRPMEVSTGLSVLKQPAMVNANHKGRMYQTIARNYEPDHLAILPDMQGACSVADGCGLLAN